MRTAIGGEGIETRVAFNTEDVDADYASLSAGGVDVDEVMRMGDPVPPMFSFATPTAIAS